MFLILFLWILTATMGIAFLVTIYALYRGFKHETWGLLKITLTTLVITGILFLGIVFTNQESLNAPKQTDYLIHHDQYDDLPGNVVPMYGKLEGIIKTEAQKNADKDFINTMNSYGRTKESASVDMVDAGWAWVERGDLDTAMRRFNQAWLLDETNIDAYKGFVYLLEETDRPSAADKIRQYVEKEYGVELEQ